MISIVRDGQIVRCRVTGNYPVHGFVWSFDFQAGSEAYASLLHLNLSNHLFDSLQKIRQEAYGSGWKDAKGRKKKCEWFGGNFA